MTDHFSMKGGNTDQYRLNSKKKQLESCAKILNLLIQWIV